MTLNAVGRWPSPSPRPISFVARVGESYRCRADGIAHVLELSESDEAAAAVHIIQQRVQARIDRGENPDFTAPTGRMLSSSASGHVAICILASIVMLVFALIGFYFYFTQPEKGGLESSIIAALAAVGLFALSRNNRPRLDVFEKELQHHSFFGKQTNLKYEAIEGLSCGITRVVNESGKEKRVHTKIAIDGPEGTVRYSDSGGGAKAIESLKETISDGLIRKFWTALQCGQSIPFGSKALLHPTGLQQPDGSIISYEDISEVRMLLGEGKIQLFLKDERRPALKTKSKEKNFYPCVELLSLLADPSITYKQFCSSTITAAAPRTETPITNDASPETAAWNTSRDSSKVSTGIQVLQSRAVPAVWLRGLCLVDSNDAEYRHRTVAIVWPWGRRSCWARLDGLGRNERREDYRWISSDRNHQSSDSKAAAVSPGDRRCRDLKECWVSGYRAGYVARLSFTTFGRMIWCASGRWDAPENTAHTRGGKPLS